MLSKDVVTIDVRQSGHLFARSQIQDYTLRGQELEVMCYYDFVLETYEDPKQETGKHWPHDNEDKEAKLKGKCRGRPRNTHSSYLMPHPKSESHCRVTRTTGHNTLLDICGPFFPNAKGDKEEFYSASMLALFLPWCSLKSIKHAGESFVLVFAVFQATAPQYVLDVISGIQYYYDCKNTASEGTRKEEGIDVTNNNESRTMDTMPQTTDTEDVVHSLTEEDLQNFRKTQRNTHEEQHGELTVCIAQSQNIVNQEEEEWESTTEGVIVADENQWKQMSKWQMCMKEMVIKMNKSKDREENINSEDKGEVCEVTEDMNVDEIGDEHGNEGQVEVLEESNFLEQTMKSLNVGDLLEEQFRAFDIVDWHLKETLRMYLFKLGELWTIMCLILFRWSQPTPTSHGYARRRWSWQIAHHSGNQ